MVVTGSPKMVSESLFLYQQPSGQLAVRSIVCCVADGVNTCSQSRNVGYIMLCVNTLSKCDTTEYVGKHGIACYLQQTVKIEVHEVFGRVRVRFQSNSLGSSWGNASGVIANSELLGEAATKVVVVGTIVAIAVHDDGHIGHGANA